MFSFRLAWCLIRLNQIHMGPRRIQFCLVFIFKSCNKPCNGQCFRNVINILVQYCSLLSICNVHTYTEPLLWLPLARACVDVTTWYHSIGSPWCIKPRIVTPPGLVTTKFNTVIACLLCLVLGNGKDNL